MEGKTQTSKVVVVQCDDVDTLATGKDLAFLNLCIGEESKQLSCMVHKNEVYLLTASESDTPRSWFLDQEIECDGKLYCATKIDPFLLLLGVFSQYSVNFIPVEQLLFQCVPAELRDISTKSNFEDIFDLRRINADEFAVKFNNDKAIRWLAAHVVRLARSFEKINATNNISYGQTTSSHFVAPDQPSHGGTGSNSSIPSMMMLQDALAFYSEFVPTSYIEKAKSLLSISETKSIPKEQFANEEKQVERQGKSESNEKNLKRAPEQPNLTVQQKKLAKTNVKGMKSMKSFFGGK